MQKEFKKFKQLVAELETLVPFENSQIHHPRIEFLRKRILKETSHLSSKDHTEEVIHKISEEAKSSAAQKRKLNEQLAYNVKNNSLPIARELVANSESRKKPLYDTDTEILMKEAVFVSRKITSMMTIDTTPKDLPRFREDQDLSTEELISLNILRERYAELAQLLGAEKWIWVRKQNILDGYNNHLRKAGLERHVATIADIIIVE